MLLWWPGQVTVVQLVLLWVLCAREASMEQHDTRRRLFWHGLLLFFFSLLSGVFVQAMTSPRMGLAAPTSGVASGPFLAGLGAVWSEVRLARSVEKVVYLLAVCSAYGGWAAVQLGAIFGTSGMTPIAGAGHTAPAYQEAIVSFILMASAAGLLLACLLLLWGLRRHVATGS